MNFFTQKKKKKKKYFFPRMLYIERLHFIFLASRRGSRINFSICCENCHVCLAAILKKYLM